MTHQFFLLRGPLSKTNSTLLLFIGFLLLFGTWSLITLTGLISEGILPSPFSVFGALPELLRTDLLIPNLLFSLKLNLYGYIEAIVVSVVLGFVIGLFPVFREMFWKPFDTIRYIPLTAITGIFIMWFGIDTAVKVHFLAFGIIVYLLPVVITRIQEVDTVYTDTVKTLQATQWQTIKSVFMPAVFAKIFDDIRVLVAISWTYIIVAELINKSGGVGGLIYTAQRQSRIDKVFLILFILIVVGFLQDKLFVVFDKLLFRYKYYSESKKSKVKVV